MTFVIDASVVAALLLPDEQPPQRARIHRLLVEQSALAPDILWYEIRNIFVQSARRGRLTEIELAQALTALNLLPIRLVAPENEDSTLHLAKLHGLTVYDASYLQLAWQNQIAIATFDAALRRAALAESLIVI